MSSTERKVHKLVDSPDTVSLTTAYALTARKDLTVPTGPGLDGITGRISCVRLYGDAHSPSCKTVSIIITYNQAGTDPWLVERTADITSAPFGGSSWAAVIQYEVLGRLTPSECPEGTVSVFMKVDSGTATCNDCHFLWEN